MADVLLGQLALLKVELQLANGLGLRLVCRRAQAVEYGGGQALCPKSTQIHVVNGNQTHKAVSHAPRVRFGYTLYSESVSAATKRH